MAISRMNMERQMRNMGGIMGLEDQRQGYFLGKLVRKAKKTVKKVVKSPLGKAALLGGLGAYAGGFGPFAKLKGAGFLRGAGGDLLTGLKSREGFLGQIGNVFRVGGDKDADFSALRLLGGLGIGSAIAAPFLMGGDEEEVDEGTPFNLAQPMISDIRDQARAYYRDPTQSSLYFMPPKSAVQSSFYAADGGLADIPRGGYDNGGKVCFPADSPAIKDFMSNMKPKAFAADGGMIDIPREGYESGERVTGILKLLSMLTPVGAAKKAGESIANMDADTLEKLSMMTPVGAAKKAGQSLANMDTNILKKLSMFTPFGAGKELAKKLAMKDGGIIDMGGLEKDYREGGFVPLGEEERADDVPARLSKNEFVFTADAVRNAGGGDIDKGAEVMQNMMDNLEAGGMISEESQGMNPAQEMFDQAQMLESRIA